MRGPQLKSLIPVLGALFLMAGCAVTQGAPSPTATTESPTPASTATPAPQATALPDDLPPEFDILIETYRLLRERSLQQGELDEKALAEGAVDGMLRALDDPYAAFLDPAHRSLQVDDYQGEFAGIGADVTMRNGALTIVAPQPGSPAEAAGLEAGDTILTVNGESLRDLPFLEQVARVRGPSGEPVTLGVLKEGASEVKEITVVRETFEIESVSWWPLGNGLAYLSVTEFIATTDRDVVEALEEIKASGARGVVLDLRNNPGGFLETTVRVADQFLEQGLVLYEVDGEGRRTDWPATPGGALTETPMVVLVNRGSASGAEVLAGALQDHGRARLVGTTTFGKGSVNAINELSDGSAVMFTIARWYTPDGSLIEGQGLTPDVVVEADPAAEGDEQLRRAVELLRERISSGVMARQ